MVPSRLPVHEWLIILLFCLILFVLAAFALIGKNQTLPIPKPPLTSNTVGLLVKIEGEVAHPGYYRLPNKTLVKKVIELAEPLATADLSQIKWRRQVREGQIIHIPERGWISIEIRGAVQQPGTLKVLSGTRCCELADQLEVLPEADLRPLRRKKRFIQKGEQIDIPAKQGKPPKKPKKKVSNKQ